MSWFQLVILVGHTTPFQKARFFFIAIFLLLSVDYFSFDWFESAPAKMPFLYGFSLSLTLRVLHLSKDDLFQ